MLIIPYHRYFVKVRIQNNIKRNRAFSSKKKVCMRRKDKETSNKSDVEDIIKQATVCRPAMVDSPYVPRVIKTTQCTCTALGLNIPTAIRILMLLALIKVNHKNSITQIFCAFVIGTHAVLPWSSKLFSRTCSLPLR